MRHPAPGRAPLAAAALAAAVIASPSLAAAAPDWNALAEVEEIEVVTVDEDGDVRETTIWLIVVDGQGYIRTGGTRWGDNVERDPNVTLRIEGSEYPLRAEFVEEDAQRERIVVAFREKYGWSDAFIAIFRGSRPKIMRMVDRPE